MSHHNLIEQRLATKTFWSSLQPYISIARPDHWFKNVFVIPGIVVPLSMDRTIFGLDLLIHTALGLAAVCLVTSSNYVLNEVLDAPFDRFHPTKNARPAAAKQIFLPAAYAQWLLLMAAAVTLGTLVSIPFTLMIIALWVSGFLYNVPPVRTKDVLYLDVLTEALNNPLRLLCGWYIATATLFPSLSLVLAYWLVACYFMALKRFSEIRSITNAETLALYRRALAHYTESSLLVSVVFYASAAMLFFGSFLIRYRLELVLSFPFVAAVMGVYLWLALQPNSVVQTPEMLYRQKWLMVTICVCTAVMTVLLFLDIPALNRVFEPTLPPHV